MIARRGFLAVVAGALGAAFLPKAKAKTQVFAHDLPRLKTGQILPKGQEISCITRSSGLARITSGSSVVVCDEVLDISPGQYLVGRGLPVGTQVVGVANGKVIALDKRAWSSGHEMISVHYDEGSAIINLRMEEAGEAVREMIANTLWR